MPVRETSRIVTIQGVRWKIGKFDALTGSFIVLKVLSKLSNILVAFLGGQVKDEAVIAIAVANELGSFSKEEFTQIQLECLHVVKELQVVGDKEVENPLRLPDGRWAVANIENDGLLIIALVSHVLLFNLTGFFDESALKEVKESFTGLLPFNAKTSTPTPTPQS